MMSDGTPHDTDAACPGCRLVTLDDGETLMLWCATCAGIQQQIGEELHRTHLHAQRGQLGSLELLSSIPPNGDSEVDNDGERPRNQTHERAHALLDDIWEHVDKYLQMAQVENIYGTRGEPSMNMQLGHNIFETVDHHAEESSGFGHPQAESQPVAGIRDYLDGFHNPGPNPPYVLEGALSQPQHSLFGIPPSPDMQDFSLWSYAGLSSGLPFASIPQQSFQALNTLYPNIAFNNNVHTNPAVDRANPAYAWNHAGTGEAEDEEDIASQSSISETDGSSVPHGMGRRGQESARRHEQGLCIWCRKPNPYLAFLGCPQCREHRREYMAKSREKQRRQLREEMGQVAGTAQVEENVQSV